MFSRKNCMIYITLVALMISMQITLLAKGFPEFPVTRMLLVAGNEINPGNCEIRWKSGSQDVEVTFTVDKKVVAKVQGKIVNSDTPFQDDSLIIVQDSSGHDVLKEIRPSGKKFKIVFE